jgi:radical SAM superfamily enzyme YgiQ (UPF0313 family)
MKVLLINPPDELEAMFGVGKSFVQKYEPLGLLYIAAVARESGYEVVVIDAHAETIGLDDLKKRITLLAPDAIGVSTLTCSGALVFELGKWLKAEHPDILVVLGNVHAGVFAQQYLEHGACDFVVHGEGDLVFSQILKSYQGDKNFADIDAISYMDDGKVVRTGPGIVVDDLSALPLPARDLVDQKLYKLSQISNQNYVAGQGDHAKTMITSRGCVYRCQFCVVHNSRKPRFNDVQKVVDEFELLEKQYNASYVYLMDPLFMGNPERVFAISKEYQRRGLKIRWGCDASVNYIKPDLVRAMAAANCYELSLGIESGVQSLLDSVSKRVKLPRVPEAIATIRENSDINIEGLFILGLPGETIATANQTINFAKSLDLDMAQFSILCPYPGSPLFDDLAEKGELDTGIRPDGGIDPSVWQRYSSYIIFTDIKPIWVTPTLNYEQLRGLQKKALRKFYLRPRQVLRQIRRIRKDNFWQSVKIAIKGFF